MFVVLFTAMLAVGLAPRLFALGLAEREGASSFVRLPAPVDHPFPCDDETEAIDTPYRILSAGTNASQREPLIARANSLSAFEELWELVARTRVPQSEPPAVDFDRETVLAIFIGERSTGGYAVDLDGVCAESPDAGGDGTTHVCYTVYEPPEGAMVTMALTAPYVLVAVEGRPTDITVHRRTATR